MNEKVAELKDRLRLALSLRGMKAMDLVNELNIPQSAISNYTRGKSERMSPERLQKIAEHLDVSEIWLLGYDVPMERTTQKKNDKIADVVLRLRTDEDFFRVVSMSMELPKSKLVAIRNLLVTFLQDSKNEI